MFSSRLLYIFALATPLYAASFPEAPSPPRLIGLATPKDACATQVFYGLQDILLGWDEGARAHFLSAIDEDPGCAVALLGSMLTSGSLPSPEARSALRDVIGQDSSMTPAESALVSTGLVLLAGDRETAAKEFQERSARWRADILSACWALLLLHDGYDETGKPRPGQTKANEIIAQLWERHHANHPSSALICYLRALMEETAPTVSDEALESAAQAARLLPGHPSPQLLLGHLLFRSGRVHDSIPHFHQAAEFAKTLRVSQSESCEEPPFEWPLEVRARLYEATALWMDGQFDAALAARRAMNAIPLDAVHAASPGAILLRWEANTLPLRILVLKPTVPYDGELAAAVKAATPAKPLENDLVLHVRDCLRFSLVARQRSAAGKKTSAIRCIEAAEKSLQQLRDGEAVAGRGRALSSWLRACEACEIAINAAKADTFKSSAEIWEDNCRRAARPSSLLMPPVIPQLSPSAPPSDD